MNGDERKYCPFILIDGKLTRCMENNCMAWGKKYYESDEWDDEENDFKIVEKFYCKLIEKEYE